MRITSNKKAGFTLVEIMIVVAIIGLLAAIAIPNFVRARTTAQTNACIANLKQIQGAVEQWALETKAPPSATWAFADISGGSGKHLFKLVNTDLKCPGGGVYTVGATVADAPTCNIANHVL